jgi:hypothetical protein
MGPETYNDLGNETYLSANRLPKGSGIEHLRDSNITDTGTVVSINSNTLVTGSLNVSSTGVFSSSVTATSFEVGNGQFFKARRSSSNLLIDLLGIESGTDNTRLLITGDYNIKNGSLATLFNMTTTGTAIFLGPTVTIGTAVAATNVKLILNGVASKAAGIEFHQSGTPQWYIGNGIASEDNNFELYNSNGTMAMKIIKSTNAINFQGAATFSSTVTAGGNFLTTADGGAGGLRLTLNNTGAGEVQYALLSGGSAGTGIFGIRNGSTGTNLFLMNGTGAATFSGALNGTSATLSANSTTVLINSATRAIDITGKNNFYAISVTGGSGTGTSYGSLISAGTNSSDVSFSVFNKAETINYFQVRGDGNVGIGTASPTKRLDVRASVAGEVVIISNDRNSTGDYAFVTSLGSNCNNTSAYHYIAATGGADRFYIYGNGTYTTVSDRRLKKDITKVTENYLDKVSRLNIVKYHWNEQSETDALEFGMIAQEVEELIPSIVQEGREDESGNKYKGIQSSVLPYILIKAIQELKSENDALKEILQRNNIS